MCNFCAFPQNVCDEFLQFPKISTHFRPRYTIYYIRKQQQLAWLEIFKAFQPLSEYAFWYWVFPLLGGIYFSHEALDS